MSAKKHHALAPAGRTVQALHHATARQKQRLPDKQMKAEFEAVLYGILTAFGRIRSEATAQYERVLREWNDYRGFFSWTEERMELGERWREWAQTTILALAEATGLTVEDPPDSGQLTSILANYEYVKDELRGKQARRAADAADLDPFKIATAAGVSKATVDRYRKDPRRVSDDKRQRIEEAIGRLRGAGAEKS